MIRVALACFFMLATTGSAESRQQVDCRDCARKLELTATQWRCLKLQLPDAIKRPHDPRVFNVGGCSNVVQSRPIAVPPCPACEKVEVKLTLNQQRCVQKMLARSIPDRAVDIGKSCARK